MGQSHHGVSRPLPIGLCQAVRLLALLCLLLAVAGCAAVPRSTPVVESARDADMFAVAYDRIQDYYVREIPMATLTSRTTQALSQRDDSLSVEFTDDQVRLFKGTALVAGFTPPRSDDPSDWADLTVDILTQARGVSPQLASLDAESTYELMMGNLVRDLDPYSRYISATRARAERGRRNGYGGIGLTFEKRDGRHIIITVFEDGPAARAGLRGGDVILSVNGSEAAPMSAEDLGEQVRGEIGSKVFIAVERNDEVRQVELTRAKVIPTFLATRVIDGVAVISLSRFTSETAERLEEKLVALNRGPEPPRAVILDLRGNPGGLLDQAVEVASLFMDSGPVISTRGRHPGSFQRFSATAGEIIPNQPMIVLVDGRSASAAEVVAAALQENGRALIAGSSTYGKGSVQTVTRLPNGGELLLTWSLIYTPKDYLLNEQGVTPYLCTAEIRAVTANGLLAEALQTKPQLLDLRRRGPRDQEALSQLKDYCPSTADLPDMTLEAAVALLNQPARYNAALLAAHADEVAPLTLSVR